LFCWLVNNQKYKNKKSFLRENEKTGKTLNLKGDFLVKIIAGN